MQGSNTTTTNYLYDGANVLETADQSGNVLARYVDTLAVDEPLSEVVSGTTSYYQQDGLGSVGSLSNSAGALAKTYTYDASLTGSYWARQERSRILSSTPGASSILKLEFMSIERAAMTRS